MIANISAISEFTEQLLPQLAYISHASSGRRFHTKDLSYWLGITLVELWSVCTQPQFWSALIDVACWSWTMMWNWSMTVQSELCCWDWCCRFIVSVLCLTDDITEANRLMAELEPTTPQEYILKGVVNAVLGQEQGIVRHLSYIVFIFISLYHVLLYNIPVIFR